MNTNADLTPYYPTQPLQITYMDHAVCGSVCVLSPTHTLSVWANKVSLGYLSAVHGCIEHSESGQAVVICFLF